MYLGSHRRFTLVLLSGWISALLPLGVEAQDELDTPSIVELASPGVVVILTYDGRGRQLGQGSGFILPGEDRVATNLHVVDGSARATVTLANNIVREVEGFLSADASHDAVVLKLSESAEVSLRLANSDSILPGADVVVVGAPLGFRQTITTGTFSGATVSSGVNWLQFSANVSPGSSGGPLLNRQGLVIGMVAKRHRTESQLNFAVPSNVLTRLLSTADSVKPLSSLPSAYSAEIDDPPSEEDVMTAPSGLTGLYVFETLSGYAFEYAWIVENPSGRISGTLFAPHKTGFFDVYPIQVGHRPGKRRDFDFRVGCVEFSGWIRENGALAGDVQEYCSGGPFTAFRARSVRTKPGKVGPLEGIQQYILRAPSAEKRKVWGLFALVGPIDLREGLVGALHVWGDLPDGPARRDLNFPRGGVGLDSTAVLRTVDLSLTVRVSEKEGALRAVFFEGEAPDPILKLVGFRSDLFYCFEYLEERVGWLQGVRAFERSMAILADSIRGRPSDEAFTKRLESEYKALADSRGALNDAAYDAKECLAGRSLLQ